MISAAREIAFLVHFCGFFASEHHSRICIMYLCSKVLLSYRFSFVALCPSRDLPSLENGFYVGRKSLTCLEGFCAIGSTSFYACNAGYNMNGSAFTTCLESGVWYPSLGECVPAAWSE